MEIHNFYKLKKDLLEDGIVLSFSGQFSQGIIKELAKALKEAIQSEKLVETISYNIFSIFIEQTQNITNYFQFRKDETPEFYNSSMIIIGKDESNYYLFSTNMICKEDIPKLSEKLVFITNSDKQEIKKAYMKQLRAERPDNQNNAGLGLYDIAKRATGTVNYLFEEKDERYSFFTLQVNI